MVAGSVGVVMLSVFRFMRGVPFMLSCDTDDLPEERLLPLLPIEWELFELFSKLPSDMLWMRVSVSDKLSLGHNVREIYIGVPLELVLENQKRRVSCYFCSGCHPCCHWMQLWTVEI